MSKIRIAIAGYGNLGKGVELAIRQNDDMELVGVFSRRPPESVKLLTAGIPVWGWMPTGIPRPLSLTRTMSPGRRSILISEQKPAMASSIELSTIS